MEIEGPTAPITGVDINVSNTKIVASSKDHHAYIWDLKTKALLDKLSFKFKPELRNNMVMRDCLFHSDGSVYTLAVEPRQPTFVVKWTPNEKDKYSLKPVAACANSKNASTGMRFN